MFSIFFSNIYIFSEYIKKTIFLIKFDSEIYDNFLEKLKIIFRKSMEKSTFPKSSSNGKDNIGVLMKTAWLVCAMDTCYALNLIYFICFDR